MEKFKLKVRNVRVYTNLEVRLKSRTTKEEANKEVERMVETKDIFNGYEWKIGNCDEDGINELNEDLKNQIVQIIGKDLVACIEGND